MVTIHWPVAVNQKPFYAHHAIITNTFKTNNTHVSELGVQAGLLIHPHSVIDIPSISIHDQVFNSSAVQNGFIIGLPAIATEEKVYTKTPDHKRLLPGGRQRGKQFYKQILTKLGIVNAWMLAGSTTHPLTRVIQISNGHQR